MIVGLTEQSSTSRLSAAPYYLLRLCNVLLRLHLSLSPQPHPALISSHLISLHGIRIGEQPFQWFLVNTVRLAKIRICPYLAPTQTSPPAKFFGRPVTSPHITHQRRSPYLLCPSSILFLPTLRFLIHLLMIFVNFLICLVPANHPALLN